MSKSINYQKLANRFIVLAIVLGVVLIALAGYIHQLHNKIEQCQNPPTEQINQMPENENGSTSALLR